MEIETISMNAVLRNMVDSVSTVGKRRSSRACFNFDVYSVRAHGRARKSSRRVGENFALLRRADTRGGHGLGARQIVGKAMTGFRSSS